MVVATGIEWCCAVPGSQERTISSDSKLWFESSSRPSIDTFNTEFGEGCQMALAIVMLRGDVRGGIAHAPHLQAGRQSRRVGCFAVVREGGPSELPNL